MTNADRNICLVRVHMSDGVGDRPTVQVWAAAVPRDRAVEAVECAIPDGWTAEVIDDEPNPDLVNRLRLVAGEVREITS